MWRRHICQVLNILSFLGSILRLRLLAQMLVTEISVFVHLIQFQFVPGETGVQEHFFDLLGQTETLNIANFDV